MRNLISFLLKFHAFFLFIFLEVLSLFLLVSLNDHQSQIYGSSASIVTGNTLNFFDNITTYVSLKDENKKLQQENASLKKRNRNSLFYHQMLVPEQIDSLFHNNLAEQQYEYLPAFVINNTINNAHNYVTLSRGSKHGIIPNTGVISNEGIVGIVRKVSTNYAVVMSILHRDTKISAKLKSNNYFGSLVWTGNDYRKMTLQAIPTHAKVSVGDTIMTSGYSTMFPKNIMIGLVDEIWKEQGDNFHTISVELSTDLKNTEYVYVVQNNMKEEQLMLENEVENER